MLKARVIPCLLLKGRGLVKTVRFKDPKYVGDPINAVKIFNEKEVDELVLLDISATPGNKKPQVNYLSQIVSESFMPLCYGGGVRGLDDIKEILALGIEKVSINSYAFENSAFIRYAANLFGSQSIVVSIDVRKSLFGRYEVYINGGRRRTGLEPAQYAKEMEELGAGEIILNSIDHDGTMEGFDIELIKKVSSAVNIPVIACGGAGKIQDLADAIRLGGASAVAAGSLFVFQRKHRAVLISYPEVSDIENILS